MISRAVYAAGIGARDPNWLGYLRGAVAALFIVTCVAYVLGLMLYTVCRRSRHAGNWTMGLVLWIFAFGVAWKVLGYTKLWQGPAVVAPPQRESPAPAAREATTLKNAVTETSSVMEEIGTSIESGEEIDEQTIHRLLQALRKVRATTESADLRESLDVIEGPIEDVYQSLSNYRRAAEQLLVHGAYRFWAVSTEQEIADRVALFQAALSALEAHRSRIAEVETRILEGAAAQGMAADQVERTFSSLRKWVSDPDAVECLQLEQELIEVGLDMAVLLEEHWSEWEGDPENKQVIFDSDELVDVYNMMFNRVNEIVAKQEEAAKRVAAKMRDSAAKGRDIANQLNQWAN
ncbi:MAG: hypothetical protein KDA20_11670 [Phycisphaerales bacterium]|nr:hypothetical protein [Phycisphaerales bacterium]